AAAVWGVAIVAFGLSSRLWPALTWLAVAGGADGISGIFRMTMWNQTIPDTLRGRLASIEMVSYSSGPLLGHFEAGAGAAALAGTAPGGSGGGRCVIGGVGCGAAPAAGLGEVRGAPNNALGRQRVGGREDS